MPAASTKACSGCGAASSRYNCPSCSAATCSLACSKAHKADLHSGAPVASTSSSPSPTPYVPLSKYNENHLLQDLTFLSHVGRHVASVGRELTRTPWSRKYLSDADGTQQQQDAKGKGKPQRPNQREQQRELLRKQAAWLKVPIMLLPDGMQMRRENRTAWLHKAQKMVYTAQLRFRSSGDKPVLSGKGSKHARETLLHRLEPDVSIERIVLEELQRRSTAVLRQLGRTADHGSDASTFRILPIVLASHGLASVPDSLTLPLDPNPSLLDADAFKPLVLTQLPPTAAVCLTCHSDRLRNEASQKFLDWWARQVAKGMDPAEEVGKPREDVGYGYEEGEKKMRVWGARPDEIPVTEATSAMQSSSPPPQPPSTLISASLLGKLSAQLKAGGASHFGAPQEAVASGSSSSPPRAPRAIRGGGEEPSPVRLSKAATAAIQPSSKASAPQQILLRLPLSSSPLTLQAMLQSLSPGLAVLEYPQLEVWGEAALEREVRRGAAVLREWEEGMDGEEGKGMGGEGKRPTPDDGSVAREEKRARFAQSEEIAAEPIPKPPMTAAAAPTMIQKTTGQARPTAPKLTSLVSYDSDSDSDLGAGLEEDDEEGAGAGRGESVARSEVLSSRPEALAQVGDDEEEGGEGKEDVDMGMGMAAYARALGLAPPVKPSKLEQEQEQEQEAEAKAEQGQGQGQVQGRDASRSASAERSASQMDEEDEVDWGEED